MIVTAAAVELRSAEGFSDWDDLLALVHGAYASMEGRIDPPTLLHRLDAAALAEKCRRERCLANSEDRLAGCVFCDLRPGALYLGKLAVSSAPQGRGTTGADGTQGRGRGPRARARRAGAGDADQLTANHAAFARMGFVRTGETAHPGHNRPTSVTMRKDLQ